MIFISKQEREAIEARVRAMQAPVLSLYTMTYPEQQDRLSTTVKSTLQKLDGVPPKVAARAIAFAERDRPLGRSLALFVGPELFEVVPFGVDLPFVDAATGTAEARWGEPYLTPLRLALDQHERFGVLFVDGWRARLFEVFIGGIDTLLERTRQHTPESENDLQQSKQVHPGYIPSRGGAAWDDAEEHSEEWRDRFYRTLVPEIARLIGERAIGPLLIMGPAPDVDAMRWLLPPPLRERIVDMLPSMADPEAAASEVLERVVPAIGRAEAARDRRILRQIAEQGVRGMAETVRRLQQGQLAVIAVPWHFDESAYVDRRTGYVSLDESSAGAHTPADRSADTEQVSLWDVLPELAGQFGTAVVFMTGDDRHRLLDEFGGLAGLRRW
jgi:peptide subunit release factor 1 (eRF1)